MVSIYPYSDYRLRQKKCKLIYRVLRHSRSTFVFKEYMDINECLDIYNGLLNKRIVIHLEDETVVNLHFTRNNIKHLLGLHKLLDIPMLQNDGRVVYNILSNGIITDKQIKKSKYFNNISERFLYFCLLPELLHSEIIIDFDSSLCSFNNYETKLKKTKYILYKKIPDTYYVAHLCLSQNINKNKPNSYYPETFFIEHSNKYLSGQALLKVTSVDIIELI